MLKMYQYSKCGTCIKAKKYLKAKGLEFQELNIRETPPTLEELNCALSCYNGDLKRLFNTSGMDYRSLNIKGKLATMNIAEALALLASNGNLVKRPFLVKSNERILVGFKEDLWSEELQKSV